MKILVIEDEHKIANALKRGLEKESYEVAVCYDGEDGMTKATTGSYDLAIVDRALPGTYDGLDIVKEMRAHGIHIPVLLLTTKDSLRDRMSSLDGGADDYLVKPFSFEVLLARVRALLRRPQDQLDSTLTYEDIVLDPVNFTVTRSGKPITLTHKEFGLLEFFMRNPGRLLSKDTLTQHVWDYDADILPNTVEVYIGYLRNKIEKPFKSKTLIQTRRGFGYIFGESDSTQA